MSENALIRELAQTYLDLKRTGDIRFPDLMAVTLGQWMLESGRGTSDLATQHFNFAGLKYRREMARGRGGDDRGAARPVTYRAHDGVDEYCKFEDPENFIFGYWRFIGRSPYRGFEEFADDPRGYIRFLKQRRYATDPDYVDKVLRMLPEAERLLASLGGDGGEIRGGSSRGRGQGGSRRGGGDQVRGDGVYFFSGSDGRVEEWRDERLVSSEETGGDADRLYRFLDGTTTHDYFIVGAGDAGRMGDEESNIERPELPMDEDEPDESEGTLADLRVALDAGHGFFRRRTRSGHDPGAVNRRLGLKEFELNALVVRTAAGRLRDMGAQVTELIYDNPGEKLSLFEKGRRAAGHDLFVSCHHNAVDSSSAQGTETLLHEDSRKRTTADEELAKHVNRELVDSLRLSDRTRGRGFRTRALGVLSGANGQAEAKCLIEPYFISHRSLTVAKAHEMSEAAGEALAQGIAEYWARR
jgi:N-acetylmuramoyl-L-alanine amidase